MECSYFSFKCYLLESKNGRSCWDISRDFLVSILNIKICANCFKGKHGIIIVLRTLFLVVATRFEKFLNGLSALAIFLYWARMASDTLYWPVLLLGSNTLRSLASVAASDSRKTLGFGLAAAESSTLGTVEPGLSASRTVGDTGGLGVWSNSTTGFSASGTLHGVATGRSGWDKLSVTAFWPPLAQSGVLAVSDISTCTSSSSSARKSRSKVVPTTGAMIGVREAGPGPISPGTVSASSIALDVHD